MSLIRHLQVEGLKIWASKLDESAQRNNYYCGWYFMDLYDFILFNINKYKYNINLKQNSTLGLQSEGYFQTDFRYVCFFLWSDLKPSERADVSHIWYANYVLLFWTVVSKCRARHYRLCLIDEPVFKNIKTGLIWWFYQLEENRKNIVSHHKTFHRFNAVSDNSGWS